MQLSSCVPSTAPAQCELLLPGEPYGTPSWKKSAEGATSSGHLSNRATNCRETSPKPLKHSETTSKPSKTIRLQNKHCKNIKKRNIHQLLACHTLCAHWLVFRVCLSTKGDIWMRPPAGREDVESTEFRLSFFSFSFGYLDIVS